MFCWTLRPTFEVPLKRFFAPTSRSRMSNFFRDLESFGKTNEKKGSQIGTFLFGSGLKSPNKKKCFFLSDFALQNKMETTLPDGLETSGQRAYRGNQSINKFNSRNLIHKQLCITLLNSWLDPGLSWGWPASKFSMIVICFNCLAGTFFAISFYANVTFFHLIQIILCWYFIWCAGSEVIHVFFFNLGTDWFCFMISVCGGLRITAWSSCDVHYILKGLIYSVQWVHYTVHST